MKLWSYTFLMIGLVIIFNLAGISTSNGLIELIGFSQDGNTIVFNYQILLGTIVSIIAGAAIVGASAGFFGRVISPKILLAALVTGGTLGLFLQSFYIILTSVSSSAFWIQAIIALIVIPMAIGYIITIADWFGGTD